MNLLEKPVETKSVKVFSTTELQRSKAAGLSLFQALSDAQFPALEELEITVRRLQKDAEMCAKFKAADHYPPEQLLKVANLLHEWVAKIKANP